MNGTFPPLHALVPSYIQKIEPYIPSKPDDVLCGMFGCESLCRLNNNENMLGPSPEALEAIRAMNPMKAAVYPSGDSYHLRQQLAVRFGLSADSFIVGNGANEVISFVINAFCQAGDNIITTDTVQLVFTAKLLFLDECQDLEIQALGVFQTFFPKAKFIFVGDVLQSIQKEPRESLLWQLMKISLKR